MQNKMCPHQSHLQRHDDIPKVMPAICAMTTQCETKVSQMQKKEKEPYAVMGIKPGQQKEPDTASESSAEVDCGNQALYPPMAYPPRPPRALSCARRGLLLSIHL